MPRTLARSSWALILPVALVLAASVARAEDAPKDTKDTKDKAASKTVTTTKSGDTVTRDGQTTLANGKTETRHSTTTKDGDTVTRDAHREGPNGGTTDAHSVRTKDGDTVTTQTTRTHTAPDGSKRTRHRHRKHAVAPPKP